MNAPRQEASNPRRARRWLFALIGIAILATGVLSQAVGDRPSPWTALRVLVSGLVLAGSGIQAARLYAALTSGGARRR